jgi:hypothetical protein
MAVKFNDVLYINSISSNEIAQDIYHLFNVSIGRIMCTGYMSRLNDGYTYIIYDGQLVDHESTFFYLSNWKYADIGEQSSLQSAKWIRSEPYVLETSPNQSYTMTKSLIQMFISEKSGIKLQIHKENSVVNLEFPDTLEQINLLKKFSSEECEIATILLNRLLVTSKEYVNVIY